MREIVDAMECGADIVKLFPGETLGPAFVKAVKGPLPQASLMPTGGVSVDNVGEWIKAGAVAVGVGGSLTAGAEKGNSATGHRHGESSLSKRFRRRARKILVPKAAAIATNLHEALEKRRRTLRHQCGGNCLPAWWAM